jgi:hypothetical protein
MALGQLRGQGPIDELIRQNPLAQQGAVILEVQCPEGIAITTQALGDEAASIVLLSETERVYRVELSLPDQLSLDRLIDRLRSQQISILAVERFRPSLEQVFMSFVGSVPPHLR